MAAEVHRDPDRLRELAAVALALSDQVAGAIVAPPDDAQCAHVQVMAARAVRELAEVGAVLFLAAQSAAAAEDAALRALRSL